MVFFSTSSPSTSRFLVPTSKGFAGIAATFRAFPLVSQHREPSLVYQCSNSLQLSLLQLTPLGRNQGDGRTSARRELSFNVRIAWCVAEAVRPVNLLHILFYLPNEPDVKSMLASTTGTLGTGLPTYSELLGFQYVVHYVNRAFITPFLRAPRISPVHLSI